MSIFEEVDMEETLKTLNDIVKQLQTVLTRKGQHKQNIISKTIKLPKPGQTIKCKLAKGKQKQTSYECGNGTR